MKVYSAGEHIAGQYEVVQGPCEKPDLRGGMGIVYLCLFEDRPVALKTFRPELLPDRAARDRFLREGKRWIQLGKHPNIVQAYGVERVGDGHEVYLVLELVSTPQGKQGPSLRAWLPGGEPLSVRDSLLFALQVTNGMVHACEKLTGFVHRDLKPANLLAGADRLPGWPINRLRVTDIGLASIMEEVAPHAASNDDGNKEPDGDPRLTRATRHTVGTPLYMAPEQWTGDALSQATDIYALGLILFEMITGETAVAPETWSALKQAHLEGKLRPAPQDLPPAVRTLLAKCLARQAEARYPTWMALEMALADAYSQVAGESPPEPPEATTLAKAERIAVGWAHNSLGGSYFDIGRPTDALAHAERAIDIGRREEDKHLEAAGLIGLAGARGHLGDYSQAVRHYEQSLEMAHASADRVMEGMILNGLGIAHVRMEAPQKAIEFLEQALLITRQTGDRNTEGAALGNLGDAYDLLEKTQDMKTAYEESLALAREMGSQSAESTALGNLGYTYGKLGEHRKALSHFRQSLEVARAVGDARSELRALRNLSIAYARLGMVREEMVCLQERIALAQEDGDRVEEGEALGNLGRAQMQLGRPQGAIELLKQQLAIAHETGSRVMECKAVGDLGIAYSYLGKQETAIDFMKQDLTISRELGDRVSESGALDNLGIAYAQMGQLGEAIAYFEASLALAEETGDLDGMSKALSNLGSAQKLLGNPSLAADFYERAATIARGIQDYRTLAGSLQRLARLYAEQGLTEQALSAANEAAILWHRLGNPSEADQARLIAGIVSRIEPILAEIEEATHGSILARRRARARLKTVVAELEEEGWKLADPVNRILSGERDEAALTREMDARIVLMVHAILSKLERSAE